MGDNYNMLFSFQENTEMEFNFIKDVEKIYLRMGEEYSREIYRNRVLAAITMDEIYIRNIILMTKEGKELIKQLQKYPKVYIYGAGIRGGRLVRHFPEINWAGYIDRSNKRDRLNGLEVINADDYKFQKEDFIFVSAFWEWKEIENSLIGKGGVPRERIISQASIDMKMYQNQYFDTEIMGQFQSGKLFIDCGSFDGSDSIKFAQHSVDGKASKMYVFEPDPGNFKVCKKNLQEYQYPNVKFFNMAVGNENAESKIFKDEQNISHVNEVTGESVKTIKLDDIVKEKTGYIKMDLEGDEENALHGAENIIRTQSPMLAVSIYHKRWDIFRIPFLLLQMNPDYTFFLRHYTTSVADTVLYAK